VLLSSINDLIDSHHYAVTAMEGYDYLSITRLDRSQSQFAELYRNIQGFVRQVLGFNSDGRIQQQASFGKGK
jgi:hypothetical protein